MDRPARRPVATVVLVASTFVTTANAGDHTPRELPSNAVQPPGASFERNITRAQKLLLVKDLVRATAAQVVSHPVRSARVGAHRLVERLGVRLAESVPVLPVPPSHQSAE